MSLFTSTEGNFEQKVKQYQSLMNEERLSMEDVIRKRQYVLVCSLTLENSNHKYSDLANLLNVTHVTYV